jgi:hypothetical protein
VKRTSKTSEVRPSKCVRCLGDVDLETFLRNDHVCDPCADLPLSEQFRYRSKDDLQTAALAAMEASR